MNKPVDITPAEMADATPFWLAGNYASIDEDDLRQYIQGRLKVGSLSLSRFQFDPEPCL